MYSCPACGAENVAQRSACACGADLTLLRKLDGLGDAWFNRALESLAAGATGRAIEWLAACCVARPNDAAACRALAKAWAQLGHWREACDALDRAVALDPQDPTLEPIREVLREAKELTSTQIKPVVQAKPFAQKRMARWVNKKQRSGDTAQGSSGK